MSGVKLHLTLHRKWFLEILSGRKTREYRRMTEYWRNRLEGREYECIRFRNGYAPDAPWMDVEWLGLDISLDDGEIVYAIRLGRQLSAGNLQCLSRSHELFPPETSPS